MNTKEEFDELQRILKKNKLNFMLTNGSVLVCCVITMFVSIVCNLYPMLS